MRIFAVAAAATVLLFAGLLTYRLLGMDDCAADFHTARTYEVLLTGFGPFDNFTANPTERVARMLNNSCRNGVCFHSHVLPVSADGVSTASSLVAGRWVNGGTEAASDHPAGNRWDAVLHLGFEDHARGLKVETMARNARARPRGAPGGAPSNSDSCLDEEAIVPGRACLLPTTAPLNLVDLPMLVQGIAPDEVELWSRDAGSYYCNEVYYRSLLALRSTRSRSLTPCLFVHMPQLNANLSLDDMAVFTGNLAEGMLGLEYRR